MLAIKALLGMSCNLERWDMSERVEVTGHVISPVAGDITNLALTLLVDKSLNCLLRVYSTGLDRGAR